MRPQHDHSRQFSAATKSHRDHSENPDPSCTSDENDILEELVLSNHAIGTSMVHMTPDFRAQLGRGYDTDKRLSSIKTPAQHHPDRVPFRWEDDLLRRGTRLCILKGLEGDVCKTAHDASFHIGFQRLYTQISTQYYIRRREKRLRSYLQPCPECQQLRTTRHKPYGSLQPPSIPLHTITMDFIVALPKMNNYDAILTVTDKFSTKVLIIPGTETLPAASWAHLLLDDLHRCDWGIPSAITSDRDPKFLSTLWRTFFRDETPPLDRVPPTDRWTDRAEQPHDRNGTPLSSHSVPRQRDRMELRATAPTVHVEQLVQPEHGPITQRDFKPREAADTTTEREQRHAVIRRAASHAIARAKTTLKQRYDQTHKQCTPLVGDQVFLKPGNYKIPRLPNRKSGEQRVGPVTTARAVGKLAYQLDLPRHVTGKCTQWFQSRRWNPV